MTATVAHLTAVGAAITSGAIVARPYAREWWVKPSRFVAAKHLLPRDPCALSGRRSWTYCQAMDPLGHDCARLDQHTGRHLGVADGRIVAVWRTR